MGGEKRRQGFVTCGKKGCYNVAWRMKSTHLILLPALSLSLLVLPARADAQGGTVTFGGGANAQSGATPPTASSNATASGSAAAPPEAGADASNGEAGADKDQDWAERDRK